jgi:hypothetical protein
MTYDGHVACTGKREGACRRLLKNARKLDRLEEIDVDERIILKWILQMSTGRAWSGFI